MLPVNEVFLSIQGEGYFTGKPAIFVRFQGCDVRCNFCDTRYSQKINPEKETFNLEYIFEPKPNDRYIQFETERLIEFIQDAYPLHSTGAVSHVVLTGGEPFYHDIIPLVRGLVNDGYYVQIETSGVYYIPENSLAWITLSPKGGCKPVNYKRANEVKIVVTDGTDFDEVKKINHKRTYLQPESQRDDMTKIAIREVIKNNWRLSPQTHKYLKVM